MMVAKFGKIWLSCFRGEDFLVKDKDNGPGMPGEKKSSLGQENK